MYIYKVLKRIQALNIFLQKNFTHAQHWNYLPSSALNYLKTVTQGDFQRFCREKNSLDIRNSRRKATRIMRSSFWDLKKVKKMQFSVFSNSKKSFNQKTSMVIILLIQGWSAHPKAATARALLLSVQDDEYSHTRYEPMLNCSHRFMCPIKQLNILILS